MSEAEKAYPCTVLADKAAVKCKLDVPEYMQSCAKLHIIERMLCKDDLICKDAHPKDSVMQMGDLLGVLVHSLRCNDRFCSARAEF